ncbi:geranylgeranylglycerol-phosphate geranylgeranyltransferase [Bacteroidota bacterium]
MILKNLRYLFEITRPINALITFIVVIVGALICIKDDYSMGVIILAGISAALTASAGNIINDIIDRDADKINHPSRPIPSGNLSVNYAVVEYILLIIVAIILAYFINQLAFVIVLLTTALLFLYSNKLKRVPLLGNITVAYLTGLAFIFGGIAVGQPRAAIIPAIFAFLINLVRELVKDIQDVEGDKMSKISTWPVKFGIKSTKQLIIFFSLLLIASTLVPFIYQLYNIEFFVIVMILVNPIMIYFLKELNRDDSTQNLNKLSNMLKLNMVIGLIAIFLGK